MSENKDDNIENSSKNDSYSSIEERVDKILSENKEKLEKFRSKEIGIERFSMKNKTGNAIYFLKKKSNKMEEEIDSKLSDKKITSDDANNPHEKPPAEQEKSEGSETNSDEQTPKKFKMKLRFGKHKTADQDFLKPTTKKDMVKSKEFDEVVSEIEKVTDNKSVERSDSIKTDKETPETKENKLNPVKIADLIDVEKKFSKKDTVPDLDSTVKKEIKKDEPLPLKENIKDIEHEKPPSKFRLSFLKKEKLPTEKETDLKPKKKSLEILKKPVFRVENVPQIDKHDEDARFLDEKIKKSQKKEIPVPAKDEVEIKAIHLTEEHLKQKKNQPQDKKIPKAEEKKTVQSISEEFFFTEGKSDQEHVFFDEEENSSDGWSPQITDKEKKSMLSLISPGREVSSNANIETGEIELPKEVLQSKSISLSDLGFSENEWEELDFYSLNEPFAYVEILRERESLDKCYFLVEAALTEEEEKLLAFIQDTMKNLEIDTIELEKKGGEEYLLDRLNQVINEYDVKIDEESRKKIFYYIGKSSLGLGKIDPILKDPNIEDISCDGASVPIFLYHRKFGSLKSNVKFNDEDELSSFVVKLAQKCGKHISIAEPMLDATMPDGSRIQMTLSDEITAKGSTFTIRKFRDDPFSPPDLVEFNTMSSEMIAYMWLAVENGVNTLFAGGTASGKTTALNALSLFIPRESKVVSIEETREINLPHPNWIPGVARSGFGQVVADKVIGEIDMYDLMKAALRQRPDYIIVGEIRGREAYVLFQAMATGHATYSTVHADSAQSLIHRLEGKPINIPRVMLQSLDIVCLHVITRVKDVRARRCRQIIEIIDIDPTTKEILTNEVFRWDPVEDKFIYSGKSYVLERVRAEKDMSREQMTEELRNRMQIIEWMNKNNIRAFRDVAKLVAQYSEAPNETLKIIEKDVKK